MALAAALAVPLSFLAEHVRNPAEASLMHQAREVGHQLDVLLFALQERWGQCGPSVQELWNRISAQGEPNMAEAVSHLGRIAPTDELRELFSRLQAALQKLRQFSMLFGAYGSAHEAYAKDLACIPSIEVLALRSSLLSNLNHELSSRTARLAADCGRSQPPPLAQALQEALNEPGPAIYARLRRQSSDQCQHRSNAGVQFPGVTSNSIPRTSGVTNIHTLADGLGRRELGMQQPGGPCGDQRALFPVNTAGHGSIPSGGRPPGPTRDFLPASAVTRNWSEQRVASDAGEVFASPGGFVAHAPTRAADHQALLARRGHPHAPLAHNQPRMEGVPDTRRSFSVAGMRSDGSPVPAATPSGVLDTGVGHMRQTEHGSWAAHDNLPSMHLGQGGLSHLGRPLYEQVPPGRVDRPHTQPGCPSQRLTGESTPRGLSVGMPGESALRGLFVGMQSGGPGASGPVRGGFVDQAQHAGALGVDTQSAFQGHVQSGNQSCGRNVPIGSAQTFTPVPAQTRGQPHPDAQAPAPPSGLSGPPAEERVSVGGGSVVRGNHGLATNLEGPACPALQTSEPGSANGAVQRTSGVLHAPTSARQQGFASPRQGGSAGDRTRVDCQRPVSVSNAGSARSGSDLSACGLPEQQGCPQTMEGRTSSRAEGSALSGQDQGGGKGEAGGVVGLPAAFAFRPNVSRDDSQLAEQGTPALNLPTGGASAVAAESEHVFRASWDTEAPSLTPMLEPERPSQAVQGCCGHTSGIAPLCLQQEGHCQSSGRDDLGLRNRPEPSQVIVRGYAELPAAGHGGVASLSGGGGEAATRIQAGRGSAELGGVMAGQGGEVINTGEAHIPGMVTGLPAAPAAATNLYMQGARHGAEALNPREAVIPGIATGIPAGPSGLSHGVQPGVETGIIRTPLSASLTGFAGQEAGQALDVVMGIPSGPQGAAPPLMQTGVDTGIIQAPVSAILTGIAQRGAGQALDVVMGIPSGPHGAATPIMQTGVDTGINQTPVAANLAGFARKVAGQAIDVVMGIPKGPCDALQPCTGMDSRGVGQVEQTGNPEGRQTIDGVEQYRHEMGEGRQIMDGCEPMGDEMGAPMLTPVDHHSSVMGRADGVRTDARTGAISSSRDMIPNTDDLLEGSEPLSGNAALPPADVYVSLPAVAVPSQRDSSSPKNRAAGQQPGPTGNEGDVGPGAILASQPPALGPALEAAAGCLSGGHLSGTAGPSPSSCVLLPRAGPSGFPYARRVCSAVDALPIICSAPPAFHSERIPSSTPAFHSGRIPSGAQRSEVVLSRPGLVMGYPAPIPARGVPEAGPPHRPAPPDGHVNVHADLCLSQRAAPQDGRVDAHADLPLSRRADGASMQPAGGPCDLTQGDPVGAGGVSGGAVARKESQPANLCMSQRADGANMQDCINQRAAGASMQAGGSTRQVIQHGAIEAGTLSVARPREDGQCPGLSSCRRADGASLAVDGACQLTQEDPAEAGEVSPADEGEVSAHLPLHLPLPAGAGAPSPADEREVSPHCPLNLPLPIEKEVRRATPSAVAGDESHPANEGAPTMPRFLPCLGPLEPYQVPSTGPSSLGTQSEDHSQRNSPNSPLQGSFHAPTTHDVARAQCAQNPQTRLISHSSGRGQPADNPAELTNATTATDPNAAGQGGGRGQLADNPAEIRDSVMATDQCGLLYEGGRRGEWAATVRDGHHPAAVTGGDEHHPTAVTGGDGHYPTALTGVDGRHPTVVTGGDGRHGTAVSVGPVDGHHGQGIAPQEEGLGTGGATVFYSARQDISLLDDFPLTQGCAEVDEVFDRANAARSQSARSHLSRGHSRWLSPTVFPQPSAVHSQIPTPGVAIGKGQECRTLKRPHEASGAQVQAPTTVTETGVTDPRAACEQGLQPSKRQRTLEGHAATREPLRPLLGAIQSEGHAQACGGSQVGISQDPPRSEGLRLELSSEEQEDPVSCLAQRDVCHSVLAGGEGFAPFTQVITPAVKSGTVCQRPLPFRQSSPWDTPVMVLGPRQTPGGGEGALLCCSAPADVPAGLPRATAGQSQVPGASRRDQQTGSSGPNTSCAHLENALVQPVCEASEHLGAENPHEKDRPTGRLLSVKSQWNGQAGVDRGGGRGLPTSNPISLSGV